MPLTNWGSVVLELFKKRLKHEQVWLGSADSFWQKEVLPSANGVSEPQFDVSRVMNEIWVNSAQDACSFLSHPDKITVKRIYGSKTPRRLEVDKSCG